MKTAARNLPRKKRPSAQIVNDDQYLTLRIPAGVVSFAAFHAWSLSDDFPEKGRITYVDQQVFIDMSREEITTHILVKGEISRVLANIAAQEPLGLFFCDGLRLSNEAAGVSNEADATFVKWETLESGRVRFFPRAKNPDQYLEIQGTPDLVVEIVSDSSVAKDLKHLRGAYHRAGIGEYWLVDARGDKLTFEILHHKPAGYAAEPGRGGWHSSPVLERHFRLTRRRGRLDLWQYTLEQRPLAK